MKGALLKLHGLILAIAVLATPIFATTVRKMELPALVSTSDNIVQGRVQSVESRYENRMVYTYISVAIDDPIKGDRRRDIIVRQLGGAIGTRAVWIPGMPQFKSGDEVIVFLKDRKDGTFDVIGLNQGKYDIVGNQAIVNVSGVTVVDPKTGVMSEAGFVDKVPLDTFKEKIRELMR
jgi:hypothetical protein